MYSLFQMHNDILVYPTCHRVFDALKRYIDVVDGRLLVKVINRTNDKDYLRKKYQKYAAIPDSGSELLVYIPFDDVTTHPNHTALAFHKAACL
ncbi:hypothetical protein BJ741DRAFT_594239, partial [Chytriomyces cf. hyalinus JEL632]